MLLPPPYAVPNWRCLTDADVLDHLRRFAIVLEIIGEEDPGGDAEFMRRMWTMYRNEADRRGLPETT